MDLDGGSLSVLDTIPLFPEPFLSETRDMLSKILHPELNTADLAFPSGGSSTMMPTSFSGSNGPRSRIGTPGAEIVDKEIRALFMRTFAKLLQGYRSCLTVNRIQPKPEIGFDNVCVNGKLKEKCVFCEIRWHVHLVTLQAAFLGQRGLINCNFMTKLVERMFFTSFVQERGPPWRSTDVWDDVYSSMSDWHRLEAQDAQMVHVHMKVCFISIYIWRGRYLNYSFKF